ncbi:MAG: hypothetical protein AB1724_02850 [Thermodesulfobacteriota bacterium]
MQIPNQSALFVGCVVGSSAYYNTPASPPPGRLEIIFDLKFASREGFDPLFPKMIGVAHEETFDEAGNRRSFGGCTMKKLIIVILATLNFISCSSIFYVRAPMLSINRPCAIFINPNGADTQKFVADNSNEARDEIMSDMSYYNSEAEEFLRREGLEVIHTNNKKIEFITSNKAKYFLEYDPSSGEISPLYLFNGIDGPFKASAPDIRGEYKEYFKN